MKLTTGNLTAGMLGALMILTACASIAPPLPPSLELPKPPSDLRAVRKGDRVTLTWTIPSSTTDRQTIHTIGPTRICRGVEAQLAQCDAPVAEILPAAGSMAAASSSKQKPTATYSDVIPTALEAVIPADQITYAVQVLNAEGTSAGPSNEVHVPAARTLPPPEKFQAQVTRDGILISWAMPPPLSQAQVTYQLRVYRRQDGSQTGAKLAEVPYLSGAPDARHTSLDQSFLDQSFAWEQTYFYRLAVVTVVAEMGKPDVTVEGDDSAEVKVFAHDIFPPAVPASLQAVVSGSRQRRVHELCHAHVY